jgi:hypothetical protein
VFSRFGFQKLKRISFRVPLNPMRRRTPSVSGSTKTTIDANTRSTKSAKYAPPIWTSDADISCHWIKRANIARSNGVLQQIILAPELGIVARKEQIKQHRFMYRNQRHILVGAPSVASRSLSGPSLFSTTIDQYLSTSELLPEFKVVTCDSQRRPTNVALESGGPEKNRFL